MVKRNVQLTGRESYTITLPKKWILDNNIKKKQPLFMKELKNGGLLIHPNLIDEDMKEVSLLVIEPHQSSELIFRSIMGHYFSGKNVMKIIGKGPFKPEMLETIKKFAENIDSVEIEEETLNSVILKTQDYF